MLSLTSTQHGCSADFIEMEKDRRLKKWAEEFENNKMLFNALLIIFCHYLTELFSI